jgi:hypothetical protein
MAENLRLKRKVTGARITKTADWWFVSIQVELPEETPVKKPAAVGIHVGLNRLATLSTGEGVENQAFLQTALKNCVRPISDCIAGFWDQTTGKKHADRWHGFIIGLPACAMMSCTS